MPDPDMFEWANEPEQVPDFQHVLGELLRDTPEDVQAGFHETLYVVGWRSGTSHGFRTAATVLADAAERMTSDIDAMGLEGDHKLAVAGIPAALRALGDYLSRCARHMEAQAPNLDLAIHEAGLRWRPYRESSGA